MSQPDIRSDANMAVKNGILASRRLQAVMLAALMVAGLALRLRGGDVRILNHDEAFTWRVASRPIRTMVQQVAGDTHPLLHFAVIKGVLLCGGDSPLALRVPSIMIGVATIWAVFALSLAAIRYAEGRDGPPSRRAAWAGLAAAAYVTLHPYHISVSGTARMYSFAAFFAALSSWLLIEALRGNRPSRWRYSAYAISVALMMHSHNFGVFIFFGQVLFASWEAIRQGMNAARLRALVEAGSLVFLLYLPWLPSFLAQARRVHEGFWIPPLTGETFGELLVNVVFGRDVLDRATGVVLACVVLLALMSTVFRVGGARLWILPVQVLTVWLLATLISTMGGRPILQERYLILACPAFAGWFALAITTTRDWFPRSLLTLNMLVPTGLALSTMLASPPTPPLSTLEAIAFLRDVHQPGDVVFVNRPGTVNVFRYYQSRTLGTQLDVRYVLEPNELKRIGQASHLSSFDHGEWIAKAQLAKLDARRLWVVNRACDPQPEDWTRQEEVTFGTSRGEFSSGIQIVCYSKFEGTNRIVRL